MRGIEAVDLKIDQILDVLDFPVSHHDRRVDGCRFLFLIGNGDVALFVSCCDGSDLQQAELLFLGSLSVEVDGELDFNRLAHRLCPQGQYILDDACQGESVILEHPVEGDDLLAFGPDRLAERSVLHIEGACDVFQCLRMLLRLFEFEKFQILQPSHVQGMVTVFQVQCIERMLAACLVSAQKLCGPLRMGGRETQGRAVVHHRLAEAEAQHSHPVLGLFPAKWIVVQGPGDSTDVWIPVGAVLAADDLLDDDCHFLILQHMFGGFQVLFCTSEIGGSPYSTDCVTQLLEPLLVITHIGKHAGLIDSGKGLVVGVLQKTG